MSALLCGGKTQQQHRQGSALGANWGMERLTCKFSHCEIVQPYVAAKEDNPGMALDGTGFILTALWRSPSPMISCWSATCIISLCEPTPWRAGVMTSRFLFMLSRFPMVLPQPANLRHHTCLISRMSVTQQPRTRSSGCPFWGYNFSTCRLLFLQSNTIVVWQRSFQNAWTRPVPL